MYGSAEEVVRAALQQLDDSETNGSVLESLRLKIQEAVDDEAAGRVSVLDMADIKAELQNRLDAKQTI